MTPLSCPACGTDLEVQDELAGRKVACPSCQAVFATPPTPPPIPRHSGSLESLRSQARNGILTDDVLASYDPKTVEMALYEIVLTTESAISTHTITERMGIVTYEAAFGMGLILDIFTQFSDFFGGRSKTTQKTLRRARNAVLRGLRQEALLFGADAVVGIDLDYNQFSGQGKSMLFLVGSGTAVRWRARACDET